MKKQVIRLTESDLHKIIKESVKKIIKEWNGDRDINPDDDDFNENPYNETDNEKVDRYHKEKYE